MKLTLLAIGRLKSGPERDLVERYRTRADGIARGLGFGALQITELPEGRERSAAERQRSEADAILSRVGGAMLVAFDERGASLGSPEFAAQIGEWRDRGRSDLAMVIGGPDGLHEDVRTRAGRVLSFGRLTLPHGLVRVLVCEQIYRVLTILSGHPYHRGE